ncbi:hypothetical protein D3C71_1357260 [compost metagenome]
MQIDVLIAFQHRQQIEGRLFQEIDFLVDQRVHRRHLIRHGHPFDLVHLHDLAPREAASRFLARDIVRVLRVDHLHPGLVLLGHKPEGTRAYGFLDRLRRRSIGDALGHHEGGDGAGLGQGAHRQVRGLGKAHDESLVIDRLDSGHHRSHHLAHFVLRRPTLDRRDAVGRCHRLAVMPLESFPQDEGIGLAIIGGFPGLQHLRLNLVVRIQGEQGVVHHVAMVPDDVAGGNDRIQRTQAGMHHRRHGLRLNGRKCGRAKYRGGGQRHAYRLQCHRLLSCHVFFPLV